MTYSVWKYPLPLTGDDFEIEIPIYSKILSLQLQGDMPCIWVQVNLGVEKQKRKFRWFGTGHPIDENELEEYIGTVVMRTGFVFHLFELT